MFPFDAFLEAYGRKPVPLQAGRMLRSYSASRRHRFIHQFLNLSSHDLQKYKKTDNEGKRVKNILYLQKYCQMTHYQFIL